MENSYGLVHKKQISICEIKWSLIRISFYILLVLTTLTGGIFTYIAAPITSKYFFNDFAFWKYLKHYKSINAQLYRIILIWLTQPSYRKSYSQPLYDPPLSGPDKKHVTLSKNWTHGESDCAGCVKCCTKIGCPLHNEYGCLSYNTPYWRYFSCGRYPVSKAQIDYYKCEKWEMRN